jgi:acyl carrier protein
MDKVMSQSVQDRVIKIISNVIDVPPSDLNEDSSPSSVNGWESMKHINLILAIEEEFDLQFDDEQIAEMQSVKTIAKTVESLLNEV